MNILIVGGGGREHALAWKIAQSPQAHKLYCAPGNAGIASLAECIDIEPSDISGLLHFAQSNKVDLTVVGPELPLTLGIVDSFEESGLKIFGPNKQAALLEGSKSFAKNIMKDAHIPTADFATFTELDSAKKYIQQKDTPVVVKADGLAAGKGVFPCKTSRDAIDAVTRIMKEKEFGDAGNVVVIEDFLEGEEASFICLADGETILPLPSSQDHKAVFDGDTGPNTGGMGAYSPAPVITPELHETVMNTILHPLISILSQRDIRYKGIIYAGLMIKNNRPKVLEFNVRFGDPETQPILFRLKTDLVDIINAVIDGNLSELSIVSDPSPAVCVVMASGGYPGSYVKGLEITGLDRSQSSDDTFVFHAGTYLDENGKVFTNGGRVLGVTSRGITIQNAIKNAYAAVDTIHWQDVHFRKDIAQKAVNR